MPARIASTLIGRYPDLVIRIDVEHEIVSPVVENYDIVFAMLEAPLPSTGIVIRKVSSLERGLYAAPSLLEKYGEPGTWKISAGCLFSPAPTMRPGHSPRLMASPNISTFRKPGWSVRMPTSGCRRRWPGTACCG